MKKALLLAALVTSTSVFAYYEDPHEQFDMTRNVKNDFRIEFKQAADVTAACDAESRARGKGGFGYKVDACSFWTYDNKVCTIITKKKATYHTLGHELRHCLQGNFH